MTDNPAYPDDTMVPAARVLRRSPGTDNQGEDRMALPATTVTLTLTRVLADLLADTENEFDAEMADWAEDRFESYEPYVTGALPPPREQLEEWLGGTMIWCSIASNALMRLAYEQADGFEAMLWTDLAAFKAALDGGKHGKPAPLEMAYVIVSRRPWEKTTDIAPL